MFYFSLVFHGWQIAGPFNVHSFMLKTYSHPSTWRCVGLHLKGNIHHCCPYVPRLLSVSILEMIAPPFIHRLFLSSTLIEASQFIISHFRIFTAEMCSFSNSSMINTSESFVVSIIFVFFFGFCFNFFIEQFPALSAHHLLSIKLACSPLRCFYSRCDKKVCVK